MRMYFGIGTAAVVAAVAAVGWMILILIQWKLRSHRSIFQRGGYRLHQGLGLRLLLVKVEGAVNKIV